MVMEINGKKDIQFTIEYTDNGFTDFVSGEPINVCAGLKCIIDYEVVLVAYASYDEDQKDFKTHVQIDGQTATFDGGLIGYVSVYASSRLIGNPVKEQLSIQTLKLCLDIW